MYKVFVKCIKVLMLVLVLVVFVYAANNSLALVSSSDLMSSSAPGVKANHTLRFGVVDGIPAGGRIEIIMDGEFTLPPDFDADDLDVAVSATYNGVYSDRSLANVVTPASETVSISTSTGDLIVSIDLDSGVGINAGEFVTIELGTNALFEKTGSSTQLINPSATGEKSIEIRTYKAGGDFIERSRIKVFIIKPVTVSNYVTKKRSDASPVGWLGYGTSETIMSLHSNFKGICRYATSTGVAYDDMTNEFSYINPGGSHYHTVAVSGLVSGGSYEFYVRCRDEFGVADDYTECTYTVASTSPFTTASGTPILEQDCIDMPIIFRISSIEGSTGDDTGKGGTTGTGDNSGSSSGSGGSGGGGSGGGSGRDRGRDRGVYLPYPPTPGAPGVILSGWGFPTSFVQIMQDGNPVGWTNSKADGEFDVFLEDLARGMYTFGVWSTDLDSVKSGTYSTTFWIEEGTQTTVTDIVIPPTFGIATSSPGFISAYGYSTPNAKIDIWIYPKTLGAVDDAEVKKIEVAVPATGKWLDSIDLATFAEGDYYIKGRTEIEDLNPSEFSQVLSFTKSGEAIVKEETGACSGADLNKDGKVNITDFSILLYYWGSNNACADQNSSGNVDLTDFSIMMYYWTG